MVACAIDLAAAFYLLRTGDRDNGVFAFVLLGLSTMQMAEGVIHTDPECESVNKAGSRFAYFSLLFLQPVAGMAGVLLHGAWPWKTATALGYLALLAAYAALTAGLDHDDAPVLSTELERNVSRWCTVDRLCDAALCPLKWEWDDLNQTVPGYAMYASLVILLPVLNLHTWEFWSCMFAVWIAVTEVFTAEEVPVLSLSASCFWGPMAAVCVQCFTQWPARFKRLVRGGHAGYALAGAGSDRRTAA